jgi:tRNA pseudouridine32 synthase/23S rRNA pseudouridine746 synthase
VTAPLTVEDVAFVKSLVIHEDEHIIALNKPSGLSSQGGRIKAHTLDDLLAAFARSNGNRPRLVHRLDRDTSGVILTARTKPAAGFLGKAMMGRRFRKTYLAIVTPGAPEPAGGVIEHALRREEIGRESYTRIARAAEPGAETALTRYRTLARGAAAALVECSPQTGRMHQIRVHLASLGRPIAGDARYGGALAVGGVAVPRLMLHAARLSFPHPAGGTTTIEAPMPADMMALSASVGLEI